MNIIIRGEILHILLEDECPIEKIIFDKIEDRNEHDVEVHLGKNNHIVSLIITDVKFDVANLKVLIQKIRENLSKLDNGICIDDLIPIITEIEKDQNIRFRINRV